MHKKNAGTLASAIFLRLAAQSFEFVLIPKREVLDFRRNLKPEFHALSQTLTQYFSRFATSSDANKSLIRC